MCKRNTVRLPLTRPQMGPWPATQAHALAGNQTSDPLVHRPALNPLSHTSQGIKWRFINMPLHPQDRGQFYSIFFNVILINGLKEEMHKKFYKFDLTIKLLWVMNYQVVSGMKLCDYTI